MNSKTVIISILVVCLFAGAIFVASLVTRSSNPAVAASSQQEETTASSSTGDQNAQEAYQTLTNELQALQSSVQKERSPQIRQDIFERMGVLLSEFMDDYSGSPEAFEAAFDAGIISFTLQKPEKAVKHLEMFLNKAADAPREKKAFGNYYLAEAYKQLGKYDDAEHVYKVVIAEYGDVDPRLSQAVQQNLAMLDSERKLAVGGEPIDFSVKDLQGVDISPAKYKGKVLLLDFWATWCAPCKQEMPNVKAVYKKYNSKGFEIVGISLDRKRGDLDKYIAMNDISWPQHFDGKFWQTDVATKYGITSIPATFLIDKKGKIRYKSLRGHQLEKAVKELLAE